MWILGYPRLRSGCAIRPRAKRVKQRDAGSEIRADPTSAGGKVADLLILPAVVVPAGETSFPANKNLVRSKIGRRT